MTQHEIVNKELQLFTEWSDILKKIAAKFNISFVDVVFTPNNFGPGDHLSQAEFQVSVGQYYKTLLVPIDNKKNIEVNLSYLLKNS